MSHAGELTQEDGKARRKSVLNEAHKMLQSLGMKRR